MFVTIKNGVAAVLPFWGKTVIQTIVLSFLMRLCFFIELYVRLQIPAEKILIVLSGFFYYDLLFVSSISVIVCIPYLIVHRLSARVNQIIIQVSLFLYAILNAILAEYYCNVFRPLDQILLVYSPQELLTTVLASTNVSIIACLFFVSYLAMWYVSLRFVRAITLSVPVTIALFAVSIISFVIFPYKKIVMGGKGYVMHSDYLMAVNQMSYSYLQIVEYLKTDPQKPSLESIQQATKWWWKSNYKKSFCDIQYPFLHIDTEPDVLGPFFQKTSDGKSPNIVLIIVESLGRKLTVDYPRYSFTPFLDSLSSEGLFWPNCVSSTERTFGVLPAVLASVPQGSQGFANRRAPMAGHESMLLNLRANGYNTSFFYGGCASFTGQENFLRKNQIGHIMEVKMDEEKESYRLLAKNYRWGLDDKDMVDSAIAYKRHDSLPNPFFDVYLTLTSHEPFFFDDMESYKKRVFTLCENDSSSEAAIIREHTNIYATFLYADDALRSLFQYYKTRPDFQNTIFVITGDHRMAPVNDGKNPLRKYNVPLIIYSPLLKQSRRMEPVVSHYDIAPSLTAYLRGNYSCEFPETTPYIGECLDTSLAFKAQKMQAFMLNNRSVEEWMHDSLFAYNNELYVIRENMDLVQVADESLLQKINEERSFFQSLSVYAVDNDYLKKSKPDNNKLVLAQESVLPNESLYERLVDSTGIVWSHINIDDDYVDLLVNKEFAYDATSKNVHCEVSFSIKNAAEQKPLPNLVYHLRNSGTIYTFPLVAMDGSSLNTEKGAYFENKITFPIDNHREQLRIYLRTKKQSDFLVKDVKIRIFVE
ncbi:MAG: LTA synthase family protein [Bacteroidales bacterium]|nr:LTA synthase family protein [Bacteroidales bacterium]